MGVKGRAGATDLSAAQEERLLGPDGIDLAVQQLGEGRLVVMANGLGGSLRAWAPFPLGRRLIPPATRAVEAGAWPFGAALRLLAASRGGPHLLRRLGVVAPSCDLDTLHALAGEFARLDWRVYARTVRAMGRHDAWPRLGEVTAPTLVVGGTRDLFLPAAALRATAAAIPDAELLVIEGASHYLPLEFPELLDRRVRRFETERIGSAEPPV